MTIITLYDEMVEVTHSFVFAFCKYRLYISRLITGLGHRNLHSPKDSTTNKNLGIQPLSPDYDSTSSTSLNPSCTQTQHLYPHTQWESSPSSTNSSSSPSGSWVSQRSSYSTASHRKFPGNYPSRTPTRSSPPRPTNLSSPSRFQNGLASNRSRTLPPCLTKTCGLRSDF